jgi:hypothetical protein
VQFTAQQTEQAGFACAVGSNQADFVARVERDIDVVEECAAGFASSENVIKNDYRWPAEYLSCWRDCCVRFASGQAVGLPHLRFYDWALRLTGISTMLVGATLIAIDRQ